MCKKTELLKEQIQILASIKTLINLLAVFLIATLFVEINYESLLVLIGSLIYYVAAYLYSNHKELK
jgi:hypothetical protein